MACRLSRDDVVSAPITNGIVRVTGSIAAWASGRYVVLGFQVGGQGATKKGLVMAFDTQAPVVIPISAGAAKRIHRLTSDTDIERAIVAALDSVQPVTR